MSLIGCCLAAWAISRKQLAARVAGIRRVRGRNGPSRPAGPAVYLAAVLIALASTLSVAFVPTLASTAAAAGNPGAARRRRRGA
jgi:hypothetical protein